MKPIRLPSSISSRRPRHLENFHEWVLSLPWVVERPHGSGGRQVRSFAVECEPLDRQRLWLLTGLRQSWRFEFDIAVMVPAEAVRSLENTGWGRALSPMPNGRVLMTISDAAMEGLQGLQAFVLTAYAYAMSEE